LPTIASAPPFARIFLPTSCLLGFYILHFYQPS
jgi:hypothetical protein